VRGSFHQGDARFNARSRGRQCTANAVVAAALTFAIPPEHWDTLHMDNILLEGDRLYKDSLNNVPAGEDYLAFDDLNITGNLIKLSGLEINVDHAHRDSLVYGMLYETSEAQNLVDGINELFTNANVGVLISHLISVGIGKTTSGSFWLFDSHSRDHNGCCCNNNGTSCIKFFPDVISLSSFFISNVSDRNAQFEIHSIRYIGHTLAVPQNSNVSVSSEDNGLIFKQTNANTHNVLKEVTLPMQDAADSLSGTGLRDQNHGNNNTY
jgi:Herpesvirus tegument protein, N-terminal conserved region